MPVDLFLIVTEWGHVIPRLYYIGRPFPKEGDMFDEKGDIYSKRQMDYKIGD